MAADSGVAESVAGGTMALCHGLPTFNGGCVEMQPPADTCREAAEVAADVQCEHASEQLLSSEQLSSPGTRFLG